MTASRTDIPIRYLCSSSKPAASATRKVMSSARSTLSRSVSKVTSIRCVGPLIQRYKKEREFEHSGNPGVNATSALRKHLHNGVKKLACSPTHTRSGSDAWARSDGGDCRPAEPTAVYSPKSRQSGELNFHLIDETPAPVFARLDGLHDRVLGGVVVLG